MKKGKFFGGLSSFYCRVLKTSLRKMFASTSRHTFANCQCNDENVIFNEWVILLNGIIKSVITVCELFYQLGNCSNNAGIRISLFLRNSIYHNTIFFSWKRRHEYSSYLLPVIRKKNIQLLDYFYLHHHNNSNL